MKNNQTKCSIRINEQLSDKIAVPNKWWKHAKSTVDDKTYCKWSLQVSIAGCFWKCFLNNESINNLALLQTTWSGLRTQSCLNIHDFEDLKLLSSCLVVNNRTEYTLAFQSIGINFLLRMPKISIILRNCKKVFELFYLLKFNSPRSN